MAKNSTTTPNGNTFGTFGGVFTPCTLTILGVIMFLRFGQVVGQSGLINALLIVLAAKLITTLTTLSLSAIATNTRVRGGGAYYLISRSLGVEFGGAIGILFFTAQAVSVAMYVIGFTEAFTAAFPQLSSHFILTATIVNFLTFACVYIGASWAIKVQYFILAILAASLASFYFGALSDFDPTLVQHNLKPRYLEGQSFFTMFALFFPAVTGIMAGANMSGDLADPSKAIPRGTLLSVLVTGLVYLSMALLLAGSRPAEDLIANNLIIGEIAVWPILITAGVFAATLSSAIGSMMGSPRILQAFANDEIFPALKFLGVGGGSKNEPRRATILTFLIAQTCILLGDLNAIAPIITMFFMITYGLLNLATFYESATKNPSYRPTFKYCHRYTSLLGATGCVAVMLLVNWMWALFSIVFIGALHYIIRSREIRARWGDLQSGVVFERARKALLQLEETVYHPKNWRPVIMALSGTGWIRGHIPIYGYWLTSGNGILTLAHVVTGEIKEHAERQKNYETTLRNFISKEGLQAFPVVTCNPNLTQGIESLLQCHGIGGFRPNTVFMGWPRKPDHADVFGSNLRLIAQMNRSIIAARFPLKDKQEAEHRPVDHWRVPRGSIDVWWRGMDNGALMLLLAHLLHQNAEWRNNPIRILRAIPSEDGITKVKEHLEELGRASRIHIIPEVVVTKQPATEIIPISSAKASVVILGFQPPEKGDELAMYKRMENLAGNLPRVLFVCSAGGMELDS